jgi:glycosyltransferase involved in cell wall biosynthesis
MKILAVEENFLNPYGGGELSFKTLLERLSEGHTIFALGKRVASPVTARGFSLTGFPVFEMPRTHFLNKFLVFQQVELQVAKYIRRISPDLILAQQDFAAPTLKSAYDAGIPSVGFIRNYEHFCLCNDPETKCDRHCSACYGYRLYNPYRYCVDAVFTYEKNWLRKASMLVSNSRYVSQVVKDCLGIDSPVVYPFVRKIPGTRTNPEYITFINPRKHKGIETVLKIADLLPERKFLIVGVTPGCKNLTMRPNVVQIPWVKDMAEVYSMTRILLVPSLWPEPLGRVCIEAGSWGIPTIASRIGGIPEGVGDGGILINNITNPEEWVQAIHALDSENVYRELSSNAVHHAKKFSLDITVQSFKNHVRDRLGLTL